MKKISSCAMQSNDNHTFREFVWVAVQGGLQNFPADMTPSNRSCNMSPRPKRFQHADDKPNQPKQNN